MPNDRFQTIAKATGFKNEDRWQGTTPMQKGKPNWSNSKVTLHTAIPAGTYGVSIWQYADTGNISFEISSDTQAPAPAPAQHLGGDVDDADF